ncbi:arsenate reductase/protein-tyrosine-phosphatase family protein [Marinigracilibium pacificum]|uniref:Protein-tyrosine-phosphatase n=1 Tax=Marinigracilibium pacificum TaxID=2729599 RepID=A0A848J2E2_9BACT|nr:protein-tyrosine-phosphatase [Marinigracilibium pacificum]NMM49891.1 protein-tyrosine-phosphatase [Marinigracilibium pacificum]
MYKKLQDYIDNLKGRFDEISDERKQILNKISAYINHTEITGMKPKLLFVCTHNSRRSQLAQVWASVAAADRGMADRIPAFSGGTEVTAFYPAAVNTLKDIGFEIDHIPEGDEEPEIYQVYYDKNEQPLICFSKVYDDEANPKEEFAAIMTCSSADNDCPFIPGTTCRIPLRYEDPKISDGTNNQKQVYAERSDQIALEMVYLFSNVEKTPLTFS